MMDIASQCALILHEQGRYEEAERELRQSLSTDADNASANAMLAMCLSQRSQLKEATAEAQRAVGLRAVESVSALCAGQSFCRSRP